MVDVAGRPRQPSGWGTTTPPLGASIDWGHGLTNGLVGCLVANGAWTVSGNRDLVAGVPMTVGGTPVITGSGAQLTANGQYIKRVMPFNMQAAYSMDGYIRIGGATKGIFFGLNNGLDTQGWGLAVGSTDADTNGTNLLTLEEGVAWTSTGATIPSSQWVHVCFTRTATPATARTYVNGKLANSRLVNNGGVGATIWIVAAQTTTTRTFIGAMSTARIWNRVLAPNEVAQLAVDPYVFFNPPGLRSNSTFFDIPGNLVTGGSLKLHSS